MKNNNKKGFTLVELVIVVAVMAVLVAVAIPTVGSIVGTAKTNVAMSNAQTIESILKLEMANTDATTLSDEAAAKAIAAAKLGITEGTFYYDAATGSVSHESNGGTTITFSETTVQVGSSSANLGGTSTPEGGEES